MKQIFFVFLMIVLLNCYQYAEENTVTFTSVYDVVDNGHAVPNGIGGFDLLSINDKVFSFDFNGDGKEDLCLYRPGQGAICVVRSNGDGTFTSVYSDWFNGIGGFDLHSIYDRVFPFDFNGDVKEDLCLYRPGQGAICVVRSNGDGTFTSVYSDWFNGIGGFDLHSIYDRVFTFDFNGDGKEDLCLYRPGQGAICVVRSNGDGTFTSVYSDWFNGIGEYDLHSLNDRVFTFDYNFYNGDGIQDLFLYRPGSGAVNVVRSNGDGTFTSIYYILDNGSLPPNGMNDYNLLSTNDNVFPFDYDGDGKEDLCLYRPGSGYIDVVQSNINGIFPSVYDLIHDGVPRSGMCGYDLMSPNDQVFPFHYDRDGKEDLFFYRPGAGAVNVVRSNGDGTFTSVYSDWFNGIGEYDLHSINDRVFPFDYDGDGKEDLCLYRPGSGAIFVVRSNDDKIFLELTSPNGGESFRVRSLQEITWSSTALDDRIKIEYSVNNGSNWSLIVFSTMNDGLFLWQVPDEISSSCLIRISENDGLPSDRSDATFAIVE